MRKAFNFRTASKENYNLFCEKNKSISISFDQYKKIIYLYNQKIVDYLIETGLPVKLPFGLGPLEIVKYKPRGTKITQSGKVVPRLGIDWLKTKEYGKYVYHLNSNTDGYKYYFRWDSRKSRLKNFIIWKLEMARVHSRKLSALLKDSKSKYKHLYSEHNRH